MMIEYYMGSSYWADCGEDTDALINRAAQKNDCSPDEIRAKLAAGQRVYYSTAAEDKLRMKPEPRKPVVDLAAPDAPAYDWYER